MLKNESWAEFMDRARKNGVSPTRQEQWDREGEALAALQETTDTDRINFLQTILKGKVVCRNSSRGRGFRLHQSRSKVLKTFDHVRDSIDYYMKEYQNEEMCECENPDKQEGFYDFCKTCKKPL